ncbi:MAG: MraY family glycosyltransferase [Prolixibacteraceae bacterium]
MIVLLIGTLVTSFLLTWISIPSVVTISKEKKLFDVPDDRKLNKTVVPTMGGIGIFIGLSITPILFMQTGANPELRYLMAALILMFFTGIKDDIMIMPARRKLVIQFLAALILVVLGNFRITHVYGMFSATVFNDWLSVPLSVLLILFLINAINLIDGIDGLAAGLALLVATFLGVWFYLAGHLNYAVVCLALSGSLVAYLRYNLFGGKNKIFMGDTGSLVLGVFLAAMVIAFNELNATAPDSLRFSKAPLIALALLIVPVTDTLRVFAIRIKNKRSPFSPDMNHLHHLLLKLRMSHMQASAFLLLYTATFVALAISLSQTGINLTAAFFILLALSFTGAGVIFARVRLLETAAKQKKYDLKVIRNNQPAANRASIRISIHATTMPVRDEQLIQGTGK